MQLRSASNFIFDHLEGIISDDHMPWSGTRQAICLGKGFSRTAAFLWFLVALVLSAGTGIGVGFAKQALGPGFAVGTGMLAVLEALQGALYWQISTATV